MNLYWPLSPSKQQEIGKRMADPWLIQETMCPTGLTVFAEKISVVYINCSFVNVRPHNLRSISTELFARNRLNRWSLHARKFWPMELSLGTEMSGMWGSRGHFPSEEDHTSHFIPTSGPTFPLPQKSAIKALYPLLIENWWPHGQQGLLLSQNL